MNSYPESLINRASLRQFINGGFDRILHPYINLMGRSWNAYLFWQVIGIAMGIAIIMPLAVLRGLSPAIMALPIVVTILMFFSKSRSAVFFSRLFSKAEISGRLLLLLLFIKWVGSGIYHYQIAMITSVAGLLWLLKQPILPYLDILVIGLSIAQVNGRIGCFMVGCCHGRPFPLGGSYGDEHLKAGYFKYLQGVRLFPIQLLESAWLLFITVIAFVLNLMGTKPGEALTWYIIAYGLGRFFFEFLRADVPRLYFHGFSESQWIALLLTSTVVILELTTSLIFHWWHAATALFLLSIVVVVSLLKHYKKLERYELLQPYHLVEFTEAVNWLFDLVAKGITITQDSLSPIGPVEAITSRHVRLSAVGIDDENERKYRYLISYQNAVMREEIARLLAGLIRQLKHPADSYEIIENEPGIFALSFRQPTGH